MTWSAVLLFAAAAVFVAYFAREFLWWRTPMGRSLMAMGVGVVMLSSQGFAFQVVGPDCPFRSEVVIGGRLLVSAALIQHTFALYRARRSDRAPSRPPARHRR